MQTLLGWIFIFVVAFRPTISEYVSQPVYWDDMPKSVYEKWYTPLEKSVLNEWNSTHVKPGLPAYNPKSLDSICSVVHYKCTTYPKYIDKMPRGFEADTPDKKVILNLLESLDSSGYHLVFLGDSMIRMQLIALVCELHREAPGQVRAVPLRMDTAHPHLSQKEYIVQFPSSLDKSKMIESRIFFMSYLDHFRGRTTTSFYEKAYGAIVSVIDPSKIIMIINLGLHESTADRLEHATRKTLEWASHNVLKHPTNIVMYRETTVQHFPYSTTGIYDKVVYSSIRAYFDAYGNMGPAYNNATTFLCPSVELTKSRNGDWRYHSTIRTLNSLENISVSLSPSRQHTLVKKNNNDKIIYVLEAAELFRSLSSMKIPSSFDCTHLCASFPAVWQAIWYQMTDVIYNAKPIS